MLNPQERKYRSKLFGNRTINSPLNSSGSLRNSLRMKKVIKNTVNEKGFKATQSFRVMGNAYGEILDEGGDPSKVNVSEQALEKWITTKPVTLEKIKDKTKAAQYMKRKIDRYGIQGTGFLQKIVDKQFNTVLGVIPSLVKDIELNLEDMFVALGWDKQGQDTFVRKI
jgi:penicillin V acylase-like amidase (Ntn superfamily)